MITKIELTNFKSHAHTVIEPGRVTALVGPNGCGKTGFLQAAFLSCHYPNHRNLPPFLQWDTIVRNWANMFKLKLGVVFADYKWELETVFSTSQTYAGSNRNWEDSYSRNGVPSSIPDTILKRIGQAIYFKSSPQLLAQPSPADQIPAKLSSDGSGLAAVIASLILSDSERHKVIEAKLNKLVPTVQNVKVRQTLVTEKIRFWSKNSHDVPVICEHETTKPGYELLFDTVSAKAVPAHSISEGTLLLLALLTLLETLPLTQLILLEDVEQGLHPLTQRNLIAILKTFAEKQGKQIILTSHSPYIIDELPAEDVWVMATDKEGISHTKRLSKHPDAERALSVLTTGEFASAEGEEWVIEENSPTETVNA